MPKFALGAVPLGALSKTPPPLMLIFILPYILSVVGSLAVTAPMASVFCPLKFRFMFLPAEVTEPILTVLLAMSVLVVIFTSPL